jgi:hypothetical protein
VRYSCRFRANPAIYGAGICNILAQLWAASPLFSDSEANVRGFLSVIEELLRPLYTQNEMIVRSHTSKAGKEGDGLMPVNVALPSPDRPEKSADGNV